MKFKELFQEGRPKGSKNKPKNTTTNGNGEIDPEEEDNKKYSGETSSRYDIKQRDTERVTKYREKAPKMPSANRTNNHVSNFIYKCTRRESNGVPRFVITKFHEIHDAMVAAKVKKDDQLKFFMQGLQLADSYMKSCQGVKAGDTPKDAEFKFNRFKSFVVELNAWLKSVYGRFAPIIEKTPEKLNVDACHAAILLMRVLSFQVDKFSVFGAEGQPPVKIVLLPGWYQNLERDMRLKEIKAPAWTNSIKTH